MLVNWAKVILKNALRDSNADLVTVINRVSPVESGPDARVPCFVPHRRQVVICPCGLNQLWYRGLARHQGPGDVPRDGSTALSCCGQAGPVPSGNHWTGIFTATRAVHPAPPGLSCFLLPCPDVRCSIPTVVKTLSISSRLAFAGSVCSRTLKRENRARTVTELENSCARSAAAPTLRHFEQWYSPPVVHARSRRGGNDLWRPLRPNTSPSCLRRGAAGSKQP
jgi:hypothetical protein